MSAMVAKPVYEISPRSHSRPITVGLVNNMPDGALKSTELQFRELLAMAAGGRAVQIRVFSIPELPRSDAGRQHVQEHHEDIAELWSTTFDGLIVTGAEAHTANLADEPCWPTLKRLIDWATERTVSTVWSCLAAHAAAFHLDGIERHRRKVKLSGVFACERVTDHPLVAFGTTRWCTPHSRYNDLPEEVLVDHGYEILSRAAGAGADIFLKRPDSVFVFLQGHPEYDAGALSREYRRDVARYLVGRRDDYPELPSGYFDAATAATLLEFREQATHRRDAELVARLELMLAGRIFANPWRPAALRLFTNWLSLLGDGRPAAVGWAAPSLNTGNRKATGL